MALLSLLKSTLAAGAVALACGPGGAAAQTYPDRPITFIVPFAPAGTVDLIAREVAMRLSDGFPRGVVVTNRAGASARIGTQAIAQAAPDGYTIGLVNIAHASNPAFGKMPYDAVKDFAPVSLLTRVPSVLLVNAALPVHSIGELIALAKSQPGRLDFGSVGVGTSNHLPMELFMVATGAKLTHVPYSNGGGFNADLMGGQVKVGFVTIPSGLAMMKTGKVRAIGVSSAQRLPAMADVPTIAESGVPGFEFYDWHGIVAPAGTPAPVIARLNAEANKALTVPALRARLEEQGAEIIGSTPEQLTTQIKSQLAVWDKVIKQSGITVTN